MVAITKLITSDWLCCAIAEEELIEQAKNELKQKIQQKKFGYC
ncbi:MAG: hypothetical protein QNJ42_01160 [Crocosphaera sp.]|nr:hypothetical protein [Crocosphaera sp.]